MLIDVDRKHLSMMRRVSHGQGGVVSRTVEKVPGSIPGSESARRPQTYVGLLQFPPAVHR